RVGQVARIGAGLSAPLLSPDPLGSASPGGPTGPADRPALFIALFITACFGQGSFEGRRNQAGCLVAGIPPPMPTKTLPGGPHALDPIHQPPPRPPDTTQTRPIHPSRPLPGTARGPDDAQCPPQPVRARRQRHHGGPGEPAGGQWDFDDDL